MAWHRMLVASQPAALSALRPLVQNGTELVPVHSIEDALRALEEDPAGFHLIATLHFDDMKAVQNAFASPEGQAAAADVAEFATGGVEMYFFDSAEV